jgi:hypothetical protein
MLYKKCLHILITILCFLFIGCSQDEKVISIYGNILANEHFELSKSEIQLVPVEEDGGTIKAPKFSAKLENGIIVEIRYPSNFPSTPIPSDLKINYKTEKLSPGKYIIAVHKLTPKIFSVGAGEVFGVRPLFDEKEQCIVIEVSKEILPPYKINIGNTIISLQDKTTVIYGEFFDYIIIKN